MKWSKYEKERRKVSRYYNRKALGTQRKAYLERFLLKGPLSDNDERESIWIKWSEEASTLMLTSIKNWEQKENLTLPDLLGLKVKVYEEKKVDLVKYVEDALKKYHVDMTELANIFAYTGSSSTERNSLSYNKLESHSPCGLSSKQAASSGSASSTPKLGTGTASLDYELSGPAAPKPTSSSSPSS
ncbi:hypothetical protein LZ554_005749 [Drepanopeziza brunnea f. sp. 'monogermtubi']|nr:hypothetical protein LZ554_005749 [Drepanopeziza brunnea f. sp. 'monogermtubi']